MSHLCGCIVRMRDGAILYCQLHQAAPSLLEACKESLEWAKLHKANKRGSPACAAWIAKLEAAIALATKEQTP